MFNRGGRIRTCCNNGSTRAWATAVTTPCRSPSRNVPSMGLVSWLPTRFRIQTPTAATLGQAATRRIRTTKPATTAPLTSTRNTSFQWHSRPSRRTTNLPPGWSPRWLEDGPSTALCKSPQVSRTRSPPAATQKMWVAATSSASTSSATRDSGPGIHTQQKWFNTSAFAQQAPYTYGNEKVNPWVGQHWNNVDLSIFRQFHLGLGEQRYFEFRAESFNLFNNVVFNPPDSTIDDTNFGQITSQWNAPRELQMSLKFYY